MMLELGFLKSPSGEAFYRRADNIDRAIHLPEPPR